MSTEQDPFEQSLRQLLRDEPPQPDQRTAIKRVLRTANRQVGTGALFSLLGRGFLGLLLGLNHASAHLKPVSRLQPRKPAGSTHQELPPDNPPS